MINALPLALNRNIRDRAATPQIALIDPALGRTGAHNRGFAVLLAKEGVAGGEIGVWCNKAIEEDLVKELTGSGVTLMPTFDIDFYQLIMKADAGIADHWDWVYGLACQYQQAFEQVLERWPRGTVHLIHHTLSWEHASALALAIELHGETGRRLQHLAFLMFSPGLDQEGQTHDAGKVLNYRLAFNTLAKAPGVSLYAGCSEYALAYARLLERSEPIPIHPCFLGDWRVAPPARGRSAPRTILLYVGEIKQDKGFRQLPQKLEQLLQTTTDTRIVIQFVAIRNEASRRIVDQLMQLADGHERVEIHQGFWTDEQLKAMLGSADMLCLNYDASAYRHATSGLLWLAAWYGLSVQVPRNCWLQREAERLGVHTVATLDGNRAVARTTGSVSRDQEYFDALFTPFWDWLKNLATARADVRDPHARTVAADVVFFWKQNDTGLYGRRSDMIIRYLASRPDVRRVLVVDAPIGDANLAKMAQATPTPTQNQRIHAAVRKKLSGACDADKISHHVYVCPLAKYRFREDGTSRPHFIEGYVDFLSKVFSSKGVEPERALFWMYPTNFHALPLIRQFQPACVVADVEDDQREFPNVSETLRKRMTENYRDMLNCADAVMANCESLRESMTNFFPDIKLVPNGCDTDPPHAVPRDNAVFDEFIGFRGKTVGFVGNLESKIDMVLLQKLADRFSDCQIVLLGSTHANPGVFSLARNPNVRMPGVVPYPEVDAWLRKFDVGLVPHLVNGLTRSMNPQKVYAYLSSHVPVVSTDVSNIPRDTDLVKIAATHEQFLDEVASRLEHDRPAASIFADYVARNSWEQRLSGFVDGLSLGSISG